MLELRILNGQLGGHRMPLLDSPLLIGSDPRCDLVLTELSVQAFHALVIPASGQAHILAIADRPLLRQKRAAMEYFRVGMVWMVLADADETWNYPVDSEIEQAILLDELATTMPSSTRPFRQYVLSTVLCLSTLWAMASACHDQLVTGMHHVDMSPGLFGALPTASDHVAVISKESASREVSNLHLQEEFKSRLASAGLLNRFSLQMSETEWRLSATLDDTELRIFEPLFVRFIHEFSVRFPVSASIPAASTLLPFTIRQVVSGANACIVTGDGRQMAVGETYAGFRLDAIHGTELTFSGKRRVVLHL
ncbi:hypothetical protein [Undibacterium sp. TS12]|uniref:hypothetical protein n=1 Tax=Undibacterium sp. TS12 TaxID=2908202 RepID=UPI001F4C8EB2|nr:hypothetical protein [Undibacterium sp. TS12]MCH8621977.1 hypothetical protein [Undibacterium sp. TS12]